jgi:hypothetical protein
MSIYIYPPSYSTGKMYPTQGILYVAPFSDEALFLEQMGKTYFWYICSYLLRTVPSERQFVSPCFSLPLCCKNIELGDTNDVICNFTQLLRNQNFWDKCNHCGWVSQYPKLYDLSLPPLSLCRQQSSFHGVDVSVLHSEAMAEYFRQPIVDTFDIRILMSRPVGHTTDFTLAHEKELHK